MAILGALPSGAFDLASLQSPPQTPFVWGQGGARLSPEDIARQRAIAEQEMAAGSDFSPVGSWTQGLARVANGLVGAIDAKRLDKAAAENAAHSDAITQALLGSDGSGASAGGSSAAILAALSDPYLDKDTKAALTMKWKHDNPAAKQPSADESLLAAAGLVPGTPDYQSAAHDLLVRKYDPFITTSLPGGGFYGGPQSGLLPVLGGGGQSSGAPGAGPATPPQSAVDALLGGEGSDEQFDQIFGQGAAARARSGATPDQGAAILEGASQTGMISPAEDAIIRSSFGPNGQAAYNAWRQQHNIRIGS